MASLSRGSAAQGRMCDMACLPFLPLHRLTAARPRHLINQCVQEVHIPAHALKDALPGFRLGMPFPAARMLKVC